MVGFFFYVLGMVLGMKKAAIENYL